ncbi:uncharacterized protein LOC113231705 isoform X2 [Hyposmocoma kahamanoa]|uniref:uncharacterized protein LOC113231705 isoform X2 n=1 Tax=Hyposmocoma kahamanoa TaxID=1477025 RepID=UPI000E6D5F0A|nr:uncharacterized protein LOC113231705 isoform X2 [Hyposmocoma kahamanoa]
MRLTVDNLSRTIRTPVWCLIVIMVIIAVEVSSLNGPNVCIEKQKYNITKRVKYRAPMSVRTYVWCFAMPPRCSRWNTEMRDLTRLETEERTAEMVVCCPGYKMKDISCVPICPHGKTGHGCTEDCPPNKWGPSCVNDCRKCKNGICSPITGECLCQDGWQEPEHITAVMGDKEKDRPSVDLISVISIAGGVMMAIITVAVIIVMVERCKKPRYEDVRKYNDIRMQVLIDNNDVPPPPYVRSIFHTPLPEPPTSEKCHYQPISTLDRNLKQFMRPVVVQTISPLMLENFRGILECHYDHLPRRSHDLDTMQARCSVPPSVSEREELLPQRVHSLTDSDIEAMKCEAKQDVIDNTTSEPLYAEIPCWRPPSEHAIEVVNLNGEAVTEL